MHMLRGISLVVKWFLPKEQIRVRFPYPAHKILKVSCYNRSMKKKDMLIIEGYELPIVIWKEENMFLAKCTKWGACYAQGYTEDNVIFEITEVAKMLFEEYQKNGEKIPLKRESNVYNPAHVGSAPATL